MMKKAKCGNACCSEPFEAATEDGSVWVCPASGVHGAFFCYRMEDRKRHESQCALAAPDSSPRQEFTQRATS